MTYVLLVWTRDMTNLLSHHHPLHFHDTMLTLLYFTEEMGSPTTHKLLNTNAYSCRGRQKTRSNLDPSSATRKQSSLNSLVTLDIQSGYAWAQGHGARFIVQDLCQRNLFLYIQHWGEEGRGAAGLSLYANNVSPVVEEQQNGNKQCGGES